MTSYCVYLTAVLCIVQGLGASPSLSLRSASLLERPKREAESESQEVVFEFAPQALDVDQQGVVGDSIRQAIDDGKEKVKDVLEKLQTKLDEAMTSVQKNFHRMQVKGDEAMVDISNNLDTITVKYNSMVDTALAKATTEAQKKCIEVAKKQGLGVIGNLARNLVSCITDKIQDARDIVMDVLTQAKRAIVLVQTTPDRFAKCTQGVGKTLADIVKITVCIGKQVIEIQAEAFGIILSISKNAMLIQMMVTTIHTDLSTCAVQQLLQVQTDVALAIREVTTCIANKV